MAEDGQPETTDAIVSYDGIFKGMYDEKVRELFQEGRRHLSKGHWTQGKATLQQALEVASDKPKDFKTMTLLMSELTRYEESKIPASTKMAASVIWSDVGRRDLARLDESFFGLPQSVFFLDIGKPGDKKHVRLVGKKTLSDLWLAFKIPELHCSFIRPHMILGLFVDQRLSDSAMSIFYHPITNAEKLWAFNNIMEDESKNSELIFPFPLMRETTRQEWGSPPEGWVVDDAYDAMLGCGEERIREYSIQFLNDASLIKPRLYDPACSTGVFLFTLQKAFPGSYTIGQDLSQQMTNFASERVDEAHCANAITPKIDPGTADAAYIRFLNSEVIKTCEAEELLAAILPTVKHGGYVITFGHTPVLLSSSNFKMLPGFTLIQSIGVAKDKSGIFQYYVIQRNQ